MNKYLPNIFEPIPSKELSYVLGVLKGDGSVYKTHRRYKHKKNYIAYMINLQVRSKPFAEKFAQCLSSIFKKEVKVIICDEKQGRGIFFKVFLASKSFYKWYNTINIYETALIFPKEFIQGVYDSEGSLGFTTTKRGTSINKYNIIRITSSNVELLIEIKNILKDYNINSKLNNRGVPKASTILSKNIVWKKEVYCLGIYNKAGVNIFLNKFSSSIPEKANPKHI
jgi:intein-encoded DNA endonuclease-like protein